MKTKHVNELTRQVTQAFASFGGGQTVTGNPISHALKDKPAVFALGVNIEEVVRFVLKGQERLNRKTK